MQVHGLSEDGSHIRIDRFDGGVTVEPSREGDVVKELLVVDVETTGLDRHADQIIEFAAAHVSYAQDGRIVRHHGTYAWLDEPDVPIPEIITTITGLTDDDVRGRHIPDADVEALFERADLIVSHNAAFDWGFCYRRWPGVIDGKVWACSLTQLDWSAFPIAKQESLARYHGFFYNAHRATIDVEALTKLLTMRQTPEAPRYLKRLVDYLSETRHRVFAWGTPFAVKDMLKERGYRWDGELRVWWTSCTDEQLVEEERWLTALYRRHGRSQYEVQTIDPAQQWA
jgi:DNA polymerase-3 subunit epsilon